ncbi:hypothetical protein ACFE04_018594 [Oxalis oulophora]
MKRQRSMDGATIKASSTTKKKNINNNIKVEEQEKEKHNDVVVNGGDDHQVTRNTTRGVVHELEANISKNVHNNVSYLSGWEKELPWLKGDVDEQMWWGSVWLPTWDVEYMSEASSNALFSDDVGDDDIWNLKNVREIPDQ